MKPNQATTSPHPARDFDGAAAFFDALAALERRVVELCLSNPREARAIADAAGLDVRHFGHQDHRLIYAAWDLGTGPAGLRMVDTLKLIRRALREAGYWDVESRPHHRGMWYSDHTLARMANTPMTVDEYMTAFARVGADGDWLGFTIATAITALIDAAEAVEVWNL